MVRNIAHVDIFGFCATLEELRRPELKKRPFVLAQQAPRAVVQAANEAARTEGVREGMPLARARQLCRRLLSLPPDPHFYREQHRRIANELGHFSPLVEGIALGHYFLDMTGTQRLWGPVPDTANRLYRHLATGQGLPARVGMAANKLVSQVAAHNLAAGDICIVFAGNEESFLSPLSVATLPGVGSKTTAHLADFNIQRIGQLAALSPQDLFAVFGKTGPRLLDLARGTDPTPVLPVQELPQLSVARILEHDEIDRERQEAVLFQLAEEAGWTLRNRNRYPGRLTLEVRYADGVTVQNRQRLPPPATHIDLRLFQALRNAFQQLVQRRIAVRRIALHLSEFSMPWRQMSMFPWEEDSLQNDRKLQQALDAVRNRFGHPAIRWGRVP